MRSLKLFRSLHRTEASNVAGIEFTSMSASPKSIQGALDITQRALNDARNRRSSHGGKIEQFDVLFLAKPVYR